MVGSNVCGDAVVGTLLGFVVLKETMNGVFWRSVWYGVVRKWYCFSPNNLTGNLTMRC